MNEIRLAEDQMRELKLCILAAPLLDVEDDGSDYDINWRQAVEMLKREPNHTPEPLDDSGISCEQKSPDLLGKMSILEMENDGIRDTIAKLETENETLRKSMGYIHRTIQSLGDKAEARKARIREVSSRYGVIHRDNKRLVDENTALKEHIAELEKQVSKDKTIVRIICTGIGLEVNYRVQETRYGYTYGEFINMESARKWCEDHGFEVVE